MAHPRPTPQQLAWQAAELSLFLHFSINTFTDREWGDGTEDPRLFNPTALDARQWVGVAREAGFRYVILTAKHHDGFCLWPTRTTGHSVAASPWRGGRGDVVREFADACREADVRMGLYLSPWDRNAPSYGDSAAYNDLYVAQLTELLTGYGPVAEVWFDGACGEGPNGRRQEYDWARYYATIRHLQPEAVIAISGPDVRWVGNEDGIARETEWSVREPHPVYHAGVMEPVWYPAECDVSIRPGWFWHAAEDNQVKSLDHLLDIYYQSVGRNSVLLLNVPPDTRGLLPDPDVQRLRELRAHLDRTFAHDLALGRPATASSAHVDHPAAHAVDGAADTWWAPLDADGAPTLEIDLGGPSTFDVLRLQEPIAHGQRVAGYRVEALTAGNWQRIASGTTIGHKKMNRFPTVTASRVRVTLTEWREPPMLWGVGLYLSPDRG